MSIVPTPSCSVFHIFTRTVLRTVNLQSGITCSLSDLEKRLFVLTTALKLITPLLLLTIIFYVVVEAGIKQGGVSTDVGHMAYAQQNHRHHVAHLFVSFHRCITIATSDLLIQQGYSGRNGRSDAEWQSHCVESRAYW